MTHLPKPSPAGCGRQLSELLAERQEPFLLDVYLMEKGHYDSLPTPRCWSSKKLTTSHGLRRRRSRFQILKCMLAKFLHGQALNWDSKKVALRLKDHHGHPSSPVSVDESKQLSPVSVLDLHREGSPGHLISTFANQFAISGKQFDEADKLGLAIEKDHKSITVCHGSLARVLADETLHLTSSEISNARREWCELQPHVREIGVYLQEVIFQDIREDVILEMLGILEYSFV